MEPYSIRTEHFEGPLDLLLALIEKRKLLINDISLAEVSSDYLTYLEQHQNFPIAETAQFVLVGSSLLLIKSKSLLPVISFTDEEQASIVDLETRLRVLERYRWGAQQIIALYNVAPVFPKRSVRRTQIIFSPLSGMSVESLCESMKQVIRNLPELRPKIAEATVEKVVSLENMMTRLTDRINRGLQVSFRQFSETTEGRVNLIVSFLAMLELVRQGIVRVEQETHHGDIIMRTDVISVPNYE